MSIVATLSVLLAGGVSLSATADEPTVEDQVRAVASEFIADAIPNEGERSVDSGPISATLPTGTETEVAVSHAGGEYTIGLPTTASASEVNTEESLATIENSDGTHALAGITSDGAVRVGVLIESAGAPTEYVYPISSEGGVSLEQVDEWIIVRDGSGQFLAYIEPAWAIDAAGNDVPTHYEVQGDSIVQIVDHAAAAYPVVADPTSSTFFEKVVIDTTSDSRGTIVRVYTKGGGPNPQIAANAIFDDYKTLVSSAYEGQKYRDQLICHVGNAIGKKPWNLDSWRPNVGYAATVAAGCNPN